jgi:RNA polymerase sigma factor (sigma-70 family)
MASTNKAIRKLDFHVFDFEYVERLKSGDSATENHFAAYFGELLSMKLRARLRSRQLAEDVQQETLMRVLQILRYKGGVEHPERFGAFVNAVCNNVLHEFTRSEGRHDAMDEHVREPLDPSVNLDASLIDEDRKRLIGQALANLPRKDRELLREVYLEERDKSEICRRHHIDNDYLRVLVHRAKARFRKAYPKQDS